MEILIDKVSFSVKLAVVTENPNGILSAFF